MKVVQNTENTVKHWAKDLGVLGGGEMNKIERKPPKKITTIIPLTAYQDVS